MGIGFLSGYVGGKSSLHWPIRSFFDETCETYIEPFAGGAAIFFSLPRDLYKKVWINDFNQNVAVFYYVLADDELRNKAVDRLLKLEKPDDAKKAKAQYKEADTYLKSIGEISIEEKRKSDPETLINIAISSFLLYTQSFNKTANGYSAMKTNADYKRDVRWILDKYLDRMQSGVKVTCDDCMEIVRSHKDEKTVQFYLDPPYIGVCRANKGKNYAVDMIDLKSHYELADCIKDAKAAVVLSGYRAPQQGVPTIYDVLLGDEWHCYSLGNVKNNAVKSNKGEKKPVVTEYIWTNRLPEMANYEVSMHDYKEKLTIDEFFNRVNSAIEKSVISNKKDIDDYKAFEKYIKEMK